MDEEQILSVQKFIARASASTTAVRGGPNAVSGVKEAARTFLSRRSVLKKIARSQNYPTTLDVLTDALCKALPRGARHWGRARKLMNIFVRDATYNCYLRKHYQLRRLERYLEVPVDRIMASKLHEEDKNLPRWKSIIALTPEQNVEYQGVATNMARRRRMHRHFLDAEFWGTRDN